MAHENVRHFINGQDQKGDQVREEAEEESDTLTDIPVVCSSAVGIETSGCRPQASDAKVGTITTPKLFLKKAQVSRTCYCRTKDVQAEDEYKISQRVSIKLLSELGLDGHFEGGCVTA